MRKWEYKIVSVKAKRNFWTSQFDVGAIEEKLNYMGQQGWELVRMEGLNTRSAISPILTFKRAI
ncbi:MAG: DUF4177 domain-containing protein [Pseudomonadota bacterium]